MGIRILILSYSVYYKVSQCAYQANENLLLINSNAI